MEQLITKYRPLGFDEVVGNVLVVKALKEAVNSDSRPHGYLFTGPAGIGKTTLSRIVASVIGATVHEFDAATNGSVDDTRNIVETCGFKPLNGKPMMWIIDECHNFSQKGFEPLLKLIEDPPSYAYFSLCSTNPVKIPKTIQTRCYPVTLKPLKHPEIEDLVATIAELENWTLTDSTFQAIVQASEGSARRAITILQAGHACVDRDELSLVISEVGRQDSPTLELCRYLVKGGQNWKQISKFLDEIDDLDEVDEQIMGYMAQVMARSEEQQARTAWIILRAMLIPSNGYNKKAKLAGAIGTILWGNSVF